MDRTKIMALCAEIERKEGEGSIYSLGSSKAVLKIPRWTTGIYDLDEIIGGGMPKGRVIEIFGAESSGKTSLGYYLSALHELALYIPIEGTFDASRAVVFGNRKKQLLVSRARYGEQAFNYMIRFATAGIPIIVLDSVPSMQPKEDIDKIKKAVSKDDEIETRIGGIARLMTKYLPTLEDIIEQTGTTVVFINQIRDKMGALPFGEQIDTPGGHKLRHSYSLRIQTARRAWIEIPNKNPSVVSKNRKVGLIQKMRIVKSKVCEPYGECEVPMFFDRGYVSFADLELVRKELMKKDSEKFGRRKKEENEN